MNEQKAAAAELENLHAATAEELTNVHTANTSELVQAYKGTGNLERCVAELEWGLESSIRGGEDTADLEVHVQTLEWELSAAEHSRMEVEEAAATWDIEKASWASERVLFGQEKELWAGLSKTLESECEPWEPERKELTANGLRNLIQHYDIPLFSHKSGLGVLVNALERHLEKYNTQLSKQRFKTCMTSGAGNSSFISWESVRPFVHCRSIVATCSSVPLPVCCCSCSAMEGGRHAEAGAARGV